MVIWKRPGPSSDAVDPIPCVARVIVDGYSPFEIPFDSFEDGQYFADNVTQYGFGYFRDDGSYVRIPKHRINLVVVEIKAL